MAALLESIKSRVADSDSLQPKYTVVSAVILTLGSVIWTVNSYKPFVQCDVNDQNVHKEWIESQCLLNKRMYLLSAYVNHPDYEEGVGRTYIAFYQWIPYIIMLQSLSYFLLGYLQTRVFSDLSHLRRAFKRYTGTDERRDKLIVYQHMDKILDGSSVYGRKCVFTLLGFVFAALQFYLVHYMFSASIGDYSNWRLFPRLVYCSVPRVIFGGNTHMYTHNCFLPSNVWYEKIFYASLALFIGLMIHELIEFCYYASLTLACIRSRFYGTVSNKVVVVEEYLKGHFSSLVVDNLLTDYFNLEKI